VTCVISGHTHIGVTTEVAGLRGPIPVRVLPSDYGEPAYAVIDYTPSLSIQVLMA
jgi:hypothetical protein